MNRVVELIVVNKAASCGVAVASSLSAAQAQKVSNELTLLANPVRLQILAILSQTAQPVCVCDLEASLPVKQPTVSHHLRILREAGLIDCEKRGLWAYYFVRREALASLRERISLQLASLG